MTAGTVVFAGGIDAHGFDMSVPERVVKLVEPDGVTRTTTNQREKHPMSETTTTPRKLANPSVVLWRAAIAIRALDRHGVINVSYSDCGTLDVDTCNSAREIGGGIGIIAILFVWAIADVIVYICHRIYVASRKAS